MDRKEKGLASVDHKEKGLALEIGAVSANDREQEIVYKQVLFLPKDLARAGARVSETGLV